MEHILQNKLVGNGRYLKKKYCQIPTAWFADGVRPTGAGAAVGDSDATPGAKGGEGGGRQTAVALLQSARLGLPRLVSCCAAGIGVQVTSSIYPAAGIGLPSTAYAGHNIIIQYIMT